MAKPVKGKRYLCKKTIEISVHNGGKFIYSNGVGYNHGVTYLSETEGCITDELGNKKHFWDDGPDGHLFSEIFEEVEDE